MSDSEPLGDCLTSTKKYRPENANRTHLTSSIQKDRVSISSKMKNRQSTRVSIISQFTKINIVYPKINLANHQKKLINKIGVNSEMGSHNQQLKETITSNDLQLTKMIQQIVEIEKLKESMEKVRQQMRISYHQGQKMVIYLQKCNEKEKALTFELKNQLNNMSSSIKRQFYEIGAHQNTVKSDQQFIAANIHIKKQQLDQKFLEVQQMTENLFRNQAKNKQYIQEAAQARTLNDKFQKKYQQQLTHICVLKLQLNPNLYAGFNVKSTGQDKSLLLDSNYTTWDRQKQRKVTIKDLKRFILIQLYRGWKRILRKLSYQSSQYGVLFGQIENEGLMENLKNLIYGQQPRISVKKIQKIIVISSSNAEQIKQQIKNELEGFRNGLIEITSACYIHDGEKEELEITYYTAAQEKKTDVYEIRACSRMSKEQLYKMTRLSERRIFLLIEIPLLMQKTQVPKYQQIYDFVRKRSLKY